MFTYFYHLRERYQRGVICLAILTDDSLTWRPKEYRYMVGPTRVHFEYGIAKIIDIDDIVLQQSPNPFALFVWAYRAARRHGGCYEFVVCLPKSRADAR